MKNKDAVWKCLNSSSCLLLLKNTDEVSLRTPKEPTANIQNVSEVGKPEEKNKTSLSIFVQENSDKEKRP